MNEDSGQDASDGTRIKHRDVIRYTLPKRPPELGVVMFNRAVQVWGVVDTESSMSVTLRRLVQDHAAIEIVTDDDRHTRPGDMRNRGNVDPKFGAAFFRREQMEGIGNENVTRSR